MERDILQKLVQWKDSRFRKPLILQGVRQVGKTWLLREFGARWYEQVAYVNFEENPDLKQVFSATREPERILNTLRFTLGVVIKEQSSLIILDEIQACPEAVTSLKYFCEQAPGYHVVCAGSLLGVYLSQPTSFPVGKVDILHMAPMTFSEFLSACGEDSLREYCESIQELDPVPDVLFSRLHDQLKAYFIIGGMPEAVHRWATEKDIALIQSGLSNILEMYERDFMKYPDRREFPKISLAWRSIPSQLAKENKKFVYQLIKQGARAREYEDALQWLNAAGLVKRVYRSSAPRLPLTAYDDLSAFKLYLVDTGLLRKLSLLSPAAFGEGNRLFTEFKGALTENYILQALSHIYEVPLRYWNDGRSRAEVDFILQRDNDILPVEVKAGVQVASPSLNTYGKLFADTTRLRIRYSLKNLHLDGTVLNIPLFLADQTDRLIRIALEQISR